MGWMGVSNFWGAVQFSDGLLFNIYLHFIVWYAIIKLNLNYTSIKPTTRPYFIVI